MRLAIFGGLKTKLIQSSIGIGSLEGFVVLREIETGFALTVLCLRVRSGLQQNVDESRGVEGVDKGDPGVMSNQIGIGNPAKSRKPPSFSRIQL